MNISYCEYICFPSNYFIPKSSKLLLTSNILSLAIGISKDFKLVNKIQYYLLRIKMLRTIISFFKLDVSSIQR